ncbi:hypothetical protein RhiirB3_489818 [Rhizophagus irregularis]|nr:hypothetical protein RhiirB3_489818 [Rhizophagus irregularis]
MFRLANLSKTVIRRYSNNNNVTSKAHEFLTSDELKTFRSAGLITFGGAAVLGNWKLVNSSIDRSLVPINSKLDHIGNQNIELIKEVHFIKDRLNLTEKDRLPEKDCDKQVRTYFELFFTNLEELRSDFPPHNAYITHKSKCNLQLSFVFI